MFVYAAGTKPLTCFPCCSERCAVRCVAHGEARWQRQDERRPVTASSPRLPLRAREDPPGAAGMTQHTAPNTDGRFSVTCTHGPGRGLCICRATRAALGSRLDSQARWGPKGGVSLASAGGRDGPGWMTPGAGRGRRPPREAGSAAGALTVGGGAAVRSGTLSTGQDEVGV